MQVNLNISYLFLDKSEKLAFHYIMQLLLGKKRSTNFLQNLGKLNSSDYKINEIIMAKLNLPNFKSSYLIF